MINKDTENEKCYLLRYSARYMRVYNNLCMKKKQKNSTLRQTNYHIRKARWYWVRTRSPNPRGCPFAACLDLLKRMKTVLVMVVYFYLPRV
jgi:hypothetical protein